MLLMKGFCLTKFFKKFFLISTFFLIITILSAFGPFYSIGIGAPIVSVVLFILFMYWSFLFSRTHFLIFLPFFYMQFSTVISCAYLEYGAYMREVQAFSFLTGGTTRLVFLNSLFFLSAAFTFRLFEKNIWQNSLCENTLFNKKVVKELCGVYLFIIIILFFNLVLFGGPYEQGVQRFAYWLNHPYPIIRTIYNLAILGFFFLGSIDSRSSGRNIYSLISRIFLILVLVLNFAHGDKFSSAIMILMLYFVGFLCFKKIRLNIREILKITVVVSILVLVFYSIIKTYYQFFFNLDMDGLNSLIFDRIFALQGQVWWTIDNLVLENKINNNWMAFFKSHPPENSGMYMLMYEVAPKLIVEKYIEDGIVFTMGYPAITIYSFGFFASIFVQIFSGCMAGLVAVYVYAKAVKFELIRHFVGMKLFWNLIIAFSMGNTYVLISKNTFLYVLIIFLDLFIYKRIIKTIFRLQNKKIKPIETLRNSNSAVM